MLAQNDGKSAFLVLALDPEIVLLGHTSQPTIGQFSRTLAKVAFVVEINITAVRADEFPRTAPIKVTQAIPRVRRNCIPSQNYVVATLRVFTLDPKLLFCGHVSSLGGVRADFEHNLEAHPNLYPKYPKLPYSAFVDVALGSLLFSAEIPPTSRCLFSLEQLWSTSSMLRW
jgi:hypothetical protein